MKYKPNKARVKNKLLAVAFVLVGILVTSLTGHRIFLICSLIWFIPLFFSRTFPFNNSSQK